MKTLSSLGLQCLAVFGFAHVVVTSVLSVDAPKTVESAPMSITCSSTVSVMRDGKLVKIASEIHDCSEGK